MGFRVHRLEFWAQGLSEVAEPAEFAGLGLQNLNTCSTNVAEPAEIKLAELSLQDLKTRRTGKLAEFSLWIQTQLRAHIKQMSDLPSAVPHLAAEIIEH